MADSCQRSDGHAAKPDSLSDRPLSCRRASSGDQHQQQCLDTTQKADGTVPPPSPNDETQSRLHHQPLLQIDTDMSRSLSTRSSSQDTPTYASSNTPVATTIPVSMKQQKLTSLSADHKNMNPRQAYELCPLPCPVSKDSMAELETHRIVNNPKLRNDVNYDRELHFRPNLDGQFGKQKKWANKNYWRAVGYELELVESILRQRANPDLASGHDDAFFQQELKTCKKRLPHVFTAVKDILVSLVPESDQERIRDRLDVDFLMQQIDNGVCDLVDLANWLAKVITTHCAPMRDKQVERMAKIVIDAHVAGDTARLTDGLRQLVDIVEAMKLDVANHHIRHIRGQLIAGTVNFQRLYNNHRTKSGKIDTVTGREWLQEEIARSQNELWLSPMTPLDALCSALLKDMAEPSPSFAPTFYLDKERLKGLSIEIHNYLCREICHNVLTALLPDTPHIFLKGWEMLQSYLVTMNGSHGHFLANVEHIAVHMSHIVAACTAKAEIMDLDVTVEATKALRNDLPQDSEAYLRQRSILVSRLIPKLQDSVGKHINMTALQLQDSLVPVTSSTLSQRSSGFGAHLEPVRPPVSLDQDHILIRKLTHIIVIHWQVWADVYGSTPEEQTQPHTPKQAARRDVHQDAALSAPSCSESAAPQAAHHPPLSP